MPPTQLPRITPVRLGSSTVQPESVIASIAADMPRWTSRPVWRTSFAPIPEVGSNSLTSPAMSTA